MQEKYNNEVVPALRKSFDLDNIMQVPRITKVVVNIGMGEAMDNPKAMEAAVNDLTIITGQKPVMTKARKSIANFKLREGRLIGTKVTLRGDRMWSFLDRLMNTALPRVRDFRGVSGNAFDGRGNYTLGLRDQLSLGEYVFPPTLHSCSHISFQLSVFILFHCIIHVSFIFSLSSCVFEKL
jgi:large subunit ribosomal protein L5